jgi:hypothetical protein
VRLEGLDQYKILMTSSGIEPETSVFSIALELTTVPRTPVSLRYFGYFKEDQSKIGHEIECICIKNIKLFLCLIN